MKNKIMFLAIFPLLPVGCASIVSGVNQSVTVEARQDSKSINDAQCELTNNKGSWYVKTPGSVTVHRSYGPLKIKCTKEKVESGIATVHSKTKGMAFGNIIFGGIIGAGVDMKTGAAYNYPNLISIIMGKTDLVIGKAPQKPKEDTDNNDPFEE